MEVLEKCRVCGHNVAKDANYCPYCAAQYPTKKGQSLYVRKHPFSACLVFFLSMILVLTAVGIISFIKFLFENPDMVENSFKNAYNNAINSYYNSNEL